MKNKLELPREHGFWTMLSAVQLVSIVRVGATWQSLLVSLFSICFCVLGAMRLGRSIRRESRLQLISSAALGCSGLAVEWVGGAPLESALHTASAWVLLFVACALLVRAAFARPASTKRPADRRSKRAPGFFQRPRALEACALSLCALGALVLDLVGARGEALVLGLSCVFLLALSYKKFSVKQLKPVGLLLAGWLSVASLILIGNS